MAGKENVSVDTNRAGISMRAPLRVPMFRRLWVSSMLGNYGLMILSVGAAWTMTQLTDDPEMVALVQTALMLPILFVALPAGALADMFDRRIVAISAVLITLAGVVALFATALLGMLDPWLVLVLCFTVGTGYALFGPVWQASAMEIVPRDELPQAIALNSISYNAARTVGPAVGGFIVAAAGANITFGVTAILYLPLVLVLMLWRRESVPSRLPPESFMRAIASGGRYVGNSPVARGILVRAFTIGICSSAILALLPLIARDLIGGGPQTFGACLGAYGLGAVFSALFVQRLRTRFPDGLITISSMFIMTVAIATVAFSRFLPVTLVALLIFGAFWLTVATVFNITIQLSAPRWVAARAVAAYQACIAGGVAVGSWLWGVIADQTGIFEALLLSSAAVLLASLFSRRRTAHIPAAGMHEEVELPPFRPELELTDRSGPILIELEYRVDPADAREFYRLMDRVRASRKRLGAYGWLIARDISDPWLWTEKFHWPTWIDYMRHRTRHTQAERELQNRARAYHRGEEGIKIKRLLERPSGSVRWRDEVPDPGLEKPEPEAPQF